MRVAIVSDIHGNRRAFEAVVADLRQVTPDLVLHGGDLAYGGAHPADIVDQVRALGWPGVRGNTDEMLWAPEGLAEFAARQPKLGPLLAIIQEMIPPTLASIGEERLRWLEQLPQQYSGEGFSQSYDGDTRASYLLMDGESVTIRRVEYDVESEAKELLSSGLPHADWLARILLAGKYCPPE